MIASRRGRRRPQVLQPGRRLAPRRGPARKAVTMTEHRYGPTRAGTVLLDLGAGTGALVLYAPADLLGAEIEISPDTPGSPRTHAAVRARPGPGGTRYAAGYAGLPAGGHVLGPDGDTPAGPVTVTGGQVTSFHWRGAGG